MTQQSGKLLIVIGSAVILIGIVVYFFGDKLHWIGRLPGDIHFERENFRFYFPITTMILASVILTLVVRLIKRL